MNDFERIYRDWHEYAKNRDTEALMPCWKARLFLLS